MMTCPAPDDPQLTQPCPLCLATARFYYRDRLRHYLHCSRCRLVFADQTSLLTPQQEKQIYDQHQNCPQDQGYRRFLGRLFEPLRSRLLPGQQGLDFGSGPGPTLSVMFEECGHPMAIYDPIYAVELQVFERRYDFITATEVVEHLHRPGAELQRLWDCLRPGGYLGLMTKMVQDRSAFSRWHYKNDPTHVCFFAAESFEWLAKKWSATVDIIGADVIIFHKPKSELVVEEQP